MPPLARPEYQTFDTSLRRVGFSARQSSREIEWQVGKQAPLHHDSLINGLASLAHHLQNRGVDSLLESVVTEPIGCDQVVGDFYWQGRP